MSDIIIEEAVKVLEDMKVKIAIPKAAELQRKRNEAIDMAIEALSCSEIPNSSDTIYRQDAIDAVDTKIKKWNAVDGEGCHVGLGLRYTDVIDMLAELPPAQPQRMHGKWIPMEVSSGRDSWKCSVCGRRARGNIKNLPYCHCGAKMEVEHE